VRQKATGFSPAPGAQRCTPCRPQQASPQRSRAQSPDKGIFAELESVGPVAGRALAEDPRIAKLDLTVLNSTHSAMIIILWNHASRTSKWPYTIMKTYAQIRTIFMTGEPLKVLCVPQ